MASFTFMTSCAAAWDLLVHEGLTVKALSLSASVSATVVLAPLLHAAEAIGVGMSVLVLSVVMAVVSALLSGGGWSRGPLCLVVAGVLMVAHAGKCLADSPASLTHVQRLEGSAALCVVLIPEVFGVVYWCCSLVAATPRFLYVQGSALAVTLAMVHMAAELLCPGDGVLAWGLLLGLRAPALGMTHAASMSAGARLVGAHMLQLAMDAAYEFAALHLQHPSAIRWFMCALLAILVLLRALVSRVSGRALSTYWVEVLGGAVGLHMAEAALLFLHVDTASLAWQLIFALTAASMCLLPVLMAGTKCGARALRLGSQACAYVVAAFLFTACVIQSLASLAGSTWLGAVSELQALYVPSAQPSQASLAQPGVLMVLLMVATASVVRVADPDQLSRYVVRCCLCAVACTCWGTGLS